MEKEIHKLKVSNYVLMGCVVLSSLVAISFANKSKQYEKDIVMISKDVADRQAEIDRLSEDAEAYENEMYWVRYVNEELTENCDTKTVNRVIKNTPLPKMKGA